MSRTSFAHGSILDIGGGDINNSIKERIQSSFFDAKRESQTPRLPEELLYQGGGLTIWNKLAYNPKYYQTHDEIRLFRENGAQIKEYFPPDSILIDLGSGNTEKIDALLAILEESGRRFVYLALDINREHLKQDLSSLAAKHSMVTCQGVFGTYTDAISWCKDLPSPRVFFWLGSTLFRGTRDEALANVRSWANILRHDDLIFVGADGHNAGDHHKKIWQSYHADPDSLQKLWENGFDAANNVMGEQLFNLDDWQASAVLEAEPVCRHQFNFRARQDLVLGKSKVQFREGESFSWLEPHKFGKTLIHELCQLAGLRVVEYWKAKDSEMFQYLLAPGERA